MALTTMFKQQQASPDTLWVGALIFFFSLLTIAQAGIALDCDNKCKDSKMAAHEQKTNKGFTIFMIVAAICGLVAGGIVISRHFPAMRKAASAAHEAAGSHYG